MRIYLADTSNERGQFAALAKIGHPNHLMSFAYKNTEQYFQITWEEQLRIFLAGNNSAPMDQTTYPLIENSLTTFANLPEVKAKERYYDTRSNVLIDSGAFTAFTRGKPIDPRDYAKWALDFQGRWSDKLRSLYFMNLDVIGDQDASWNNQARIEALGLNVLPIVTYNADLRHLDRALTHPYLALGGLVPYATQPKVLKAWLDRCFSRIMEHYRASNLMPKVHILGITRDWVCDRYPIYSCDSSTWTQVLRFGSANKSGLGKVPLFSQGDGAKAANIQELCSSIKFYQQMELNGTNLWKSRGIFWVD